MGRVKKDRDLISKSSYLMEEFKSYLVANDRKPRSVKRHLANLKRILNSCPHLTKDEVESFFVALKEKGCKNTYLNSLTCTIRQYGRFKQDSSLISLRFRKKEEFSKATMSDQEIEAFLGLPPITVTRKHRNGKMYSSPIDPKLHHKWTIFFTIMAFSGMRPGEVANLKVGDVDFGRGVFVITDSKTNKPGIAPIAPNILGMVKEYVSSLSCEQLFVSVRGGNKDGVTPVWDNVDWHYNFHKRLSRLNIKRPNLTPYSLRHSYATRLLESNVSLFHVKKLLRHSDLKSTLVYEHLTTKDLIEAVQKLPLVRKGTQPNVILQALVELIKSFHIEKDNRFDYVIEESGSCLKFEAKIK